MSTNNFLPFSPTDIGTNLLTQSEYAADADRTVGNQPGVASSKLNNKAIRQANVIASQLAQFVCNKTGSDMLDNGDLTTLLTTLTSAFAPTTQEYDITNLTLATSVATSALTIAVKTKAGSNASATDPITVGVRSSTLTSGVYLTRSITSSLSMVVSSGSTLGQTSALPAYIYVYLIDNAGTLELAVSGTYYAEDQLVSTTAEGGAGAADSATVIYSTTARTNVAFRLIGYIINTQAAAGTWTSAGTQLQLLPANRIQPGLSYFSGFMSTASSWTTNSATFADPTNSGGNALTQRFASGLTVTAGGSNVPGITFTPTSFSSAYTITAQFPAYNGGVSINSGYRLLDSNSNTLTTHAIQQQSGSAVAVFPVSMSGICVPGSTSPITVKIQVLTSNVSNAATIAPISGSTTSIEWTVTQLRN